MKVMISSDGPHAHYHIRMGWGRVFDAMGYEATLWDIHKKNAFDAFDEFEPDMFFGQTYNLDDALYKCIKERPHLKVMMKGADWGDMQNEINPDQYGVLFANEEEKKLVEKLKAETGKPDFLHIYYHDNWVGKTHNGWEETGCRTVSIMNGADIFMYTGGTPQPEYECDVSFVGGYWPYKAQNMDRYLMPLAHPVGKYNVKFFGNQGWPGAHYMGWINDDQVKHLLASSKICPNISEPHATDFGFDVNERTFKILSNKSFCISDHVQSMKEDIYTNDEVVFANTPEEFHELVNHFVKYPNERLPYIRRGYKTVMDNHTYFHRVSKMLHELGLEDESERCLLVYEKVKQMLGIEV